MVKSQFEKKLTSVFQKEQAKGLWWKFQLSSMKNGKVRIFYVAQWSKWLKNNLKKNWPLFFKKSRQGGCGENFSSRAWKMAKLAIWCFTVFRNGEQWIWKKFDHCLWKRAGKGTVVKFSALCMKNGKFRIFMLHNAVVKNGVKSIWKSFYHCDLEKIRQEVCGENFSFLAWKMAKLAFLMLHSGQKRSKFNLTKFEICLLPVCPKWPCIKKTFFKNFYLFWF